MKIIRKILGVFILATSLSSCGFDFTTNEITIELPNTYGVYVEAVFETPQFILDNNATFDEVVINYTVRKNDAFAATVKIYVSADQFADGIEMPGDEDVINVTMGVNEYEKSGVATSALLVDILNNKQPYFVVGGQNLSLSPTSSIYIDITIRLKGHT